MIREKTYAFLLIAGMSGPLWSAEPANSALEILERNCIECHNAHDKKGDVILDRAPLVIDDLQQILDAVSGTEPEMPPERDPLTSRQIEVFKQWIAEGAMIPEGRILRDTRVADRKWWSLQAIQNPKIPSSHQDNRGRNPIDHFVLTELEKQALSPSPPADPRTLIRRLTFDLTGLPPLPGEVTAFLEKSAIDSEGAYRELVEKLLASPRYGEQQARHWLDAARYGESHGSYDKDKARFHAWPYRDYVIESFNRDKPWTRFIQEQVAGDVLWPGTPDGIVALGFVAAGPWDYIAHSEVGEKKLDGRIAKHLDRDDMVSVIFNTFMSTTVQCAQCHNHKFDPVSMEDYYRLHSIFAAVDRVDRVYDLDPDIIKKRGELEEKLSRVGKELEGLKKEIEKDGGEELNALQARVTQLKKSQSATTMTVPEHGYHSQISKDQNEAKWVELKLPEAGAVSRIRLIGSHDNYAGIGAGFGFPIRFQVAVDQKVIADYSTKDFPNPGLAPVEIEVGKNVRLIRISASKLAERKNDFIFALGEVEVLDADGKNLAGAATVTAKDSIEAGLRWGRKNLIDGKFSTGADPVLMVQLQESQAKLKSVLSQLETPERIAKRESLTRQQSEMKKALAALPEGKLVYSLATHFQAKSKVIPTKGEPRPIHLLHRGDLRSPGDKMVPGAPALWEGAPDFFSLADPDNEGERREGLARYLTDPENPLVWRSAVNRIWLQHMGRGIVDSPNDFGRMGMLPSHPELLDWLAFRFRETQSVKDLHRLIVSSATYRQSSHDNPDKAKIDGGNVYYWRMKRRRLRAEELRDSVLQVSGVLDLKMGGPSFRDFKFKDDHTPKYWYHLHDPTDPETHRRTIYRFIARSQTQPFLTTLDCADPSQMVAKRDETTTALQALVLMNNPFMTAMSVELAESAGSVEEAFVRAFSRKPNPEEKTMLEEYAQKHGLKAMCRLLFNLNEFSYVD